MAHVLVVEDDSFLQSLLSAQLRTEGMTVTTAQDGREMMSVLERDSVDLILLDLGLPDEDGLVLARRLRAHSSIPLMVLTQRNGRDDRLSALKLGADDYLVKPCDTQELVLRVKNLLARAGATQQKDESTRFADWQFDVAARVVINTADGRRVTLTPAEFRLLSAFVRAPFRVLTRGQLLDAAARDQDSASERLVDVLVSHLRKKLESDARNPTLIQTVHGAGYKFTPPG